SSLLVHKRRTHSGDGRDAGQGLGEIGVVDAVGHLNPIRPDAVTFDGQTNRFRQPGHGLRVTGIDTSLGGEPGDCPVHQAAVDERQTEPVRHALAHSRLASCHPAIDGDDQLGSIRTARRSASTSGSPSTRQSPTFKRPSFKGPKPVRLNDWTLCPTTCSIRRTCRCRPSRMTTRSSVRGAPGTGSKFTTSISAGAVLPTSSSTPFLSDSRSVSFGLPATIARYSLATL